MLDPSLHFGSSNCELPFLTLVFLGSNQLIFPPEWCHVDLASLLFGLVFSSKVHESNLWLSSNRITLFHWTLNLGSSFKVALRPRPIMRSMICGLRSCVGVDSILMRNWY
jgi:hypothetical protein